MEKSSSKIYKYIYWIFLIAGLLGLANFISHGWLFKVTMYLYSIPLLGPLVAMIIRFVLDVSIGFFWTFLIMAFLTKQKLKLNDNPTEEEIKKYKNTRFIIICLIVLGLIILALGFVFVSSLKF